MNFIRRIQAERAELEARIDRTDDAISDAMAFLNSPKFVGVESDGSRKDWISTADVHHMLAHLRETIRTEVREEGKAA